MSRTLWLLVFFAGLPTLLAQTRPGIYRPEQQQNFALNYSSPKTYTIHSVRIEGNNFLDEDILLSIAELAVGDNITLPSSKTRDIIKRIWNQSLVSDISLDVEHLNESSIGLVLRIKERPRLAAFIFKGVSKSKRKEITEAITLKKGRIITDLLLKETENAVRHYFAKKGYINAVINVSQQAHPSLETHANLLIDVDKKKRIYIRNIAIRGQDTFTKSLLVRKLKGMRDRLRFTLHQGIVRDFVYTLITPRETLRKYRTPRTTRQQWLTFRNFLHKHAYLNFFRSAKYEEQKYQDAKDNLIAYLHSKGYQDATFLLDTVQVYPKHIDVDLVLYLGQPYYIRHITWKGNFLYDDQTLQRILNVEKGSLYNPELIQKKLQFNPTGQDISSLYLDDGYLFFQVQPVEINIESDSVDLEMKIFEGKQATIDQVLVRGNERTYEHVIRRELLTFPNQKFSRRAILRSQQQLAQLPFIEAQETQAIPIPKENGEKVDIEWNIGEKSGDQVELSAGWGGRIGLVGSVGFVLNNFSLRDTPYPRRWRPLPSGEGQTLAIRVRSNGRQFSSFSTSFTEPWLGGKRRNALSLSYSYSIERYYNRRRRVFDGSIRIHGVSVGLARALRLPDPFFSLAHTVSYRGYLLDNANTRFLGFDTGKANSVSLTTIFQRNDTDDPIFPTQGASIALSMELTPPLSLWRDIDYQTAPPEDLYRWIEYHKWIFDIRYYVPLIDKFVLESRGHFGLIGKYTKKTPLTPFERFSLGGDGIVGRRFALGTDIIGLRGYPNSSIVPLDEDGQTEGGIFFNKFVLELRYPVISVPGVGRIFLLSFLEGGNNWNTIREVSPFDLFKSAGFGMRALLPAVGFLGLDWGRRFDPLPGRFGLGSEFHFSIGRTIR